MNSNAHVKVMPGPGTRSVPRFSASSSTLTTPGSRVSLSHPTVTRHPVWVAVHFVSAGSHIVPDASSLR